MSDKTEAAQLAQRVLMALQDIAEKAQTATEDLEAMLDTVGEDDAALTLALVKMQAELADIRVLATSARRGKYRAR